MGKCVSQICYHDANGEREVIMRYPKIGIRPVIDGRWGGVRESLENQTCEMAKIAAKLISENLKYPDGTPVQCVIGCTTIGGGAEAARVAEQFQMENVVATLSVTPCWCYGTETFDMDPNTIKAVWGFNGTERPGAVYLAAVMAAHAQRGLPAFSIYGHDVQDAKDTTIPADVSEKILRFARGAVAVGWMTNKAYVNIGAVAMGIAGSFCDPDVLQKYFGIRAEWVDEVEILRRIAIGIYDPEEYEKALQWVKVNCREGFDKNLGKDLSEVITKSKIIPAEKDWEFIVKMTLIIRDILFGNPHLDELGWHEEALGHNAVAGGFQGQRQWTDWLPNADFTEAILASTFDWNGSKAPTPEQGNHVMKPFWKMTEEDIRKCLDATDWCRADYEYFRGGGYSSHFRCIAQMPVTMLRFNIIEGIGPVLQIAEGWTAKLPEEIHHAIDKRTDPTWPTTWFCPRLTGEGAFTDVYSVMANWGANHGVTVYGHVGADLITLSSMLRIPVTMHNVDRDKIYRPHAWSSFGTQDTQAADYAACRQYGPLYR